MFANLKRNKWNSSVAVYISHDYREKVEGETKKKRKTISLKYVGRSTIPERIEELRQKARDIINELNTPEDYVRHGIDPKWFEKTRPKRARRKSYRDQASLTNTLSNYVSSTELHQDADLSIFHFEEKQRLIEGCFEILEPLSEQLNLSNIIEVQPSKPSSFVQASDLSKNEAATNQGNISDLNDCKSKNEALVQSVKLQNTADTSNKIIEKLAMLRVISPNSKARSLEELAEDCNIHLDSDRTYRAMDHLHPFIDKLKKKIFDATCKIKAGNVVTLLFDVTTLVIESTSEDELRKFGFSKDCKFNNTQVVLALATTEEGLPIGYQLFPGNTGEVSTLLVSIKAWQKELKIEKMSLVADRAMCSKANIELLEASDFTYTIAAPIKKMGNKKKREILENPILKGAREEYLNGPKIKEPSKTGEAKPDLDAIVISEFIYKGSRLIVTFSPTRAHKDKKDRDRFLEKVRAKVKEVKDDLEKKGQKPEGSISSLITNKGYIKFIEVKKEEDGKIGTFSINEEKIKEEEEFDGLHGVITNDLNTKAEDIIKRYKQLYMIEDSFRVCKTNLEIRPIYHHKMQRVESHIAICYLAFALLRFAAYKLKEKGVTMSPARIQTALGKVQASILQHRESDKILCRVPSVMTEDAKAIYKVFGIERNSKPEFVRKIK